MEMTEGEICRDYKLSKDKCGQIGILADINGTDRAEITDILLRGGQPVRIQLPSRGRKRKREMTDKEYLKALFRRLDYLDAKITKLEKEYATICTAIKEAEKGME